MRILDRPFGYVWNLTNKNNQLVSKMVEFYNNIYTDDILDENDIANISLLLDNCLSYLYHWNMLEINPNYMIPNNYDTEPPYTVSKWDCYVNLLTQDLMKYSVELCIDYKNLNFDKELRKRLRDDKLNIAWDDFNNPVVSINEPEIAKQKRTKTNYQEALKNYTKKFSHMSSVIKITECIKYLLEIIY